VIPEQMELSDTKMSHPNSIHDPQIAIVPPSSDKEIDNVKSSGNSFKERLENSVKNNGSFNRSRHET
jgi:hypothetical protein